MGFGNPLGGAWNAVSGGVNKVVEPVGDAASAVGGNLLDGAQFKDVGKDDNAMPQFLEDSVRLVGSAGGLVVPGAAASKIPAVASKAPLVLRGLTGGGRAAAGARTAGRTADNAAPALSRAAKFRRATGRGLAYAGASSLLGGGGGGAPGGAPPSGMDPSLLQTHQFH